MPKLVTIVGVGALGSHLVQFLRTVPDITIRVIDFDRIETKNTLAQFHARSHVGKLKAPSLQQTMFFLWGTRIEVSSSKLVSDNVRELLGKADLVIDCLDNGEARRLVQGFVRKGSIPCLHGALAADGGFGRVVWDESFIIDDEGVGGAATCEAGEHLPFIAIVSAYLARAAQMFLVNGKKVGFQVSPGGSIKT